MEYFWNECDVPLIGCVVRELEEGRDGTGGRDDYKHWVFAATKLTHTGKRMIQTYQLRLLVVGEYADATSQAVEGWSMGYG